MVPLHPNPMGPSRRCGPRWPSLLPQGEQRLGHQVGTVVLLCLRRDKARLCWGGEDGLALPSPPHLGQHPQLGRRPAASPRREHLASVSRSRAFGRLRAAGLQLFQETGVLAQAQAPRGLCGVLGV